MTARTPLLVLALLCLAASRPAAQPLSQLSERFTAHLNGDVRPDGRVSYPALWSTLDTIVLRTLNEGSDAAGVSRVLQGLAGYAGASPGEGFQVGGTSFYSELPRATPNYFVAPVRVGADTVLLGIYNFGISEPGRLSVFARRGRRWTRTGGFDPRNAVEAHLLPLGPARVAVVTLDRFVGADRQEGGLKVWTLESGGTLRLQEEHPGRMIDYQVSRERGALLVGYTRFPEFVSGSVLGTRLAYELALTPEAGRVRMRTTPLNPWVIVVEDYYRHAGRGETARARALLADPALARVLGREGAPSWDDDGDARAGHGHLVVTVGDGRTRAYRVESRRDASGRWKITAAVPVPDPLMPE